MKRFFTVAVMPLLLLTLLSACSEDQPQIRIRNENDKKVNVQIKPEVGSTININGVAAGETSNYQDLTEGRYFIKASIQSGEESNELMQDIRNDNRYEIIVSSSNPPVLSIVNN